MYKSFLTIIAILAAVAMARADVFYSGGLCYQTLDDAPAPQVEVAPVWGMDVPDYEGVYVIPERVYYEGENYEVVAIGDSAFWLSHATQVQVPNTVRRIGVAAFALDEELTDITLPLHLRELAPYALAGTAVTDVVLPEGVEFVGENAFDWCTQLHTVILPSTLEEIDASAFDGCFNLYEVYCAAPVPPIVTGDVSMTGIWNVDLVVLDADARELYEVDDAWGDLDAFAIYLNEDFSVPMFGESEDFADTWISVGLGNHVAYKIYDGFGDLMAVTAASDYYFDKPRYREQYEIVPTVLMGSDADVLSFTALAPQATPVEDLTDRWTDPMVYAYNGVIYIKGDNYGTWTEVYDIYGNLYYQRPSVKGDIPDLPRNRVYIVRVGNYVKKVFL